MVLSDKRTRPYGWALSHYLRPNVYQRELWYDPMFLEFETIFEGGGWWWQEAQTPWDSLRKAFNIFFKNKNKTSLVSALLSCHSCCCFPGSHQFVGWLETMDFKSFVLKPFLSPTSLPTTAIIVIITTNTPPIISFILKSFHHLGGTKGLINRLQISPNSPSPSQILAQRHRTLW